MMAKAADATVAATPPPPPPPRPGVSATAVVATPGAERAPGPVVVAVADTVLDVPAVAACARRDHANGDVGVSATGGCTGEWVTRGKQISILERDGKLVLEMGPDAPVLNVVPIDTPGSGAEAWPMRWAASRQLEEMPGVSNPTLYIVEMSTPASQRLFVKRPQGESMVEFVRKASAEEQVIAQGQSHSPPCAPKPVAPTAAASKSKSRSRTRSKSKSKSKSRSQSPSSRSKSPSKKRGGAPGSMPGDWACPRCNFRNFARNLSCAGCGAAKPGGGCGGAGGGGEREPLVTRIKHGQRASVAFKERWWSYCDRYGNGFYDPVRHETRFLEDFLEQEKRGKKSKSRSSGSGSRSRSRSRRRRRRRRKGKSGGSAGGGRRRKRRRRHKRDRGDRKRKKRRRSRSRSPSESSHSSASGGKVPSTLAAARDALLAAERALEDAKKSAVPEVAEALRQEEERQKEEVATAMQRAKEESAKMMNTWLREAEQKLLEEKRSRLKEAEQRLDKDIAKKMKVRIEEVARKELAERVDKAEQKLQAAKERLMTLRGDEKRPGSKSAKGGKDGADSRGDKRTKGQEEVSNEGSNSDDEGSESEESASSSSVSD